MMYYIRAICLLACALFLASCGGGGGSSGGNPNQPALINTAGDVLTIPAGAFREYSLSGGVPPYQASSSEPAIAVGNVNGNSLSIGAIAGGKASIRVFDRNGATVSTEVTVGSSIPLYTTAPGSVNIGINVTREFAVGGGSPPYTFTGSNDSVAVVQKIDATHWSVTGRAANSTGTVKIRDQAGAVVDVAFSTTPPELRISPDKLTMPAGMEAQVTLSGGQPPYSPAGGIPAAIQVSPASSADGKFKIVGNLASKLDVTFIDAAGQSAKVEVEINTATTSFRLSPSPVSISENSIDDLSFSLFGFYGDSGTGASSGSVCVYVSDPRYFVLDSSRTTCSTFSASLRTFKLVTGTRGNRCVSADTPIGVRVVDSQGSVASGTITIVNNGTSCGGSSSGLSVTPSAVSVQPGLSAEVVVRGGDGRYTAVSGNLNVATVKVTGDIVTVTGGTASGVTTVTVTDADTGLATTFSVTNGSGSGPGALTFSSTSVAVTPGLSNGVAVFGGSGSYFAATSNPAIATATVSGSTVTVTGGATRGLVTVTVTDTVTGNSGTLNVTNGNVTGALTFSPSPITVAPGAANTVVISGGSGNYQVASSAPAVATGAVSGSVLTITGGSTSGTASVTVTDTSTNTFGTVAVTNSGALVFSSQAVVVFNNQSRVITISGGAGRYSAASTNAAIAAVTVAGSNLTITGGATTGQADITVTDSVTGVTGVVAVTNGTAGTLFVSPTEVTVGGGNSATVVVTGGSGNYVATTFNAAIVTASADGNVITIASQGLQGSTTVQITDTSTQQVAFIAVQNVNTELRLSSSLVALAVNASQNAVVSGGSGNFVVTSSDATRVTASITGRDIVLRRVATGNATVVVTDVRFGTTVTLVVTEAPYLALVGSTAVVNALTVPLGDQRLITVVNGTGDVVAISSDAAVTATVTGRVIAIQRVTATTLSTVTVTIGGVTVGGILVN